ncbi:type III restriction protein res subunit [Natronorubrum tibetense GA33]|uniref:Type III restriction protein res subunit n=1 Tax=Natronorubrum tibetense GA33 TaxID=1114856 RepID=L9VS16_9EURY|nr:type III restriction protein res subunit [Natronorubrum tibetense GA33]
MLQNADDIGGNCSEVTIQLTEDSLVFQNHEEPMSVKNVEALGAYTRSTKQGDLDSIGHFGIGFKTVFSLANVVYVHSGFFSFRYTTDERTVPQPVGQNDQPATDDECYDGTTITLPLTDDAKKNRREILEEQLDSIGSLLPFLNNIDTVHVSAFGERKTFRASPIDDGGFEVICEQNGEPVRSERMRLFSGTFEPDRELVNYLAEKRNLNTDALREQTLKLDIEIAIPIDTDGAPMALDESHLFCYFPTEPDTNLPFHIQADFSLKPDRKHIIWPDEFNEQLLNCAVDVFETAFVQLHSELVDPSQILELVPDPNLEREMDPYIDPLVTDIVSFVRSESCVPDGRDNLFQPSEVVFFADPFRDLFTEAEVSDVLDRPVKYPSEQISDTARERLQAVVPDSQLQLETFLDHCTDSSLFESKSDNWLIRFLAGIMRHWSSEYEVSRFGRTSSEEKQAQKEFTDSLEEVSFLPLEDGSVTSYAGLEKTLYRLSGNTATEFDIFTESDNLILLSSDFVSSIEEPSEDLEREASLAQDLLFDELLEIPELKSTDVVQNVINPAFENGNLTPERADEFIRFVAKRPSTLSDVAQLELQTNTDDATVQFQPPETLYFGPEYIDDYDTDTIFRIFDDVDPISGHYLELGELSKEEWIEALATLGVRRRIRVEKQDPWESDRFKSEDEVRRFLEEHGDEDKTEVHDEKLLDGYNGTANKWRWMKRENRRGRIVNYKYAVIDRYLPDETEAALRAVTGDNSGVNPIGYWTEFFKMIDEWWDSYYQSRVYRSYRYSTNKSKYKVHEEDCYCPSSFGTFLQEAMCAPGSDKSVHRAQNLFVRNELTEDKPVTFIEPEPKSLELIEFLGIRQSPGVQVTISTLSQQIDTYRRDLDEFHADEIERTIRQQLWAISEKLPELDAGSVNEDVVDQLKDLPFVFVRNAETPFRKSSQVTWSGQSLGDYLVPVSDIYPDAWPLLKELDTKKEPELDDYISFLGRELSDSEEEQLEGTDRKEAWWQVLQEVVYLPRDQVGGPADPLEKATTMLEKQGSVPTAANTLSAYGDVEYHSDNSTLVSTLPTPIQERILHLERNQRYTDPVYEERLETLTGTNPLEPALRTELTTPVPDDMPAERLTENYSQVLDVAYSYVQSTESSGVERLQKMGGFSVYRTDEISCTYFLNGEYVVTTNDRQCFIDVEEKTIVLRDDDKAGFALIDALTRELELESTDRSRLSSLMKGAVGKSDELIRAFLEDSEYKYHVLPAIEVESQQETSTEETKPSVETEEVDEAKAEDEESRSDTSTTEEPTIEEDPVQPESTSTTPSPYVDDQIPSLESEAGENTSVTEESDEITHEEQTEPSVEKRTDESERSNQTAGSNDINRTPIDREKASSSTTNREKTQTRTGNQNRSRTRTTKPDRKRGDKSESTTSHHRKSNYKNNSGGSGGFGHSDADRQEIGDCGEQFVFDELRRVVENYLQANGRFEESIEDEENRRATIRGECDGEERLVEVFDVSTENRGYDILLEGAKIAGPATDLTIAGLGQKHQSLVEVKASKGDEVSTFTLTSNEHATAVNRPDSYRVVRVHHALSDNPHVYRVFDRVPTLTKRIDDIEYRPDGVRIHYRN